MDSLQQFSHDIKENNGSDMFTMRLWIASQGPFKPGVYFIHVELRNIKKIYSVMFNKTIMGLNILDAQQINLREAIDLAWITDSSLRKAYFQMCSMINE